MQNPTPLNYATWADRLLAALIDLGIALAFMIVLWIVMWIVSFILQAIAGGANGRADAAGFLGCGICLLSFVLPPASYFLIGLLNKVYLVNKRGASIGQAAMKLRVVDKDGNLLSIGTAFLRLVCQVALTFIPVIGGILDLIWPLFDDPTRQTLHDKAVASYVIKVG